MSKPDHDSYPVLTFIQRMIAITIQTGIIQPCLGETIHIIPGDLTQEANFLGNVAADQVAKTIRRMIWMTRGRGIFVDEAE
jgi:hypothetical protein